MSFTKIRFSALIILIVIFLSSCKQSTQWGGQEPIKKVSTLTVPIQLQHKAVFNLGDDIFITNNFEGARLNGVARSNDSLITVLITAENSPINTSPWYAFKIWAKEYQEINLKLTYPADAGHRYFPKLSQDGLAWTSLDSTKVIPNESLANEALELPKDLIMKLSIGPDTLWISAQELLTTKHANQWMNGLAENTFVTKSSIAKSHEGRPISLLKIGEADDKNMIMVLSRQHPPEITGYLGMKAFVETLCSDHEIAKAFRKQFNAYVIPMVNPDGVYHGHWRHNKGGIDLNRDWEDFNQPETAAIRDFMKQKTEQGGKIYFGIDFHSTWKDIYYTIDPELKGNMPGLVPAIIKATGEEFTDYQPNIKPRSMVDAKVSSLPYFFFEFGAEALTYEIGDDTPRDFLQKKGEITALKMMEIMLDRMK